MQLFGASLLPPLGRGVECCVLRGVLGAAGIGRRMAVDVADVTGVFSDSIL
jgi:hypothetical protein